MRSYLLLFVFAVFACVTNPYTGEKQFLLTSESEEMALRDGVPLVKQSLERTNLAAVMEDFL